MAERIFLRATGLALIDGLLFGSAWSGPLTYSFPDAPSDYALPYSALSEPSSSAFAAVTATQRQAVRFILEGISPDGGGPVMRYGSFAAVSGVNLACAGFDDADIRIAATGAGGSTAHAYLPSLAPAGGDVWFSAYGGYGSPVLGDYAYLTHIHELGHSLGLKHSFEYGGPGFAVVPLARDSLEFTVMSYRSYVGAGINSGYTNETFGYPQTPMMLDIITLQYMYGANFATHAEDTSYRWNPMTGEMFVNGFGQGMPGANRVFLTIWDGGGFDTYDLSDYYTPTAIDLNPGNWSITAQAQRANLNAYGSGGPVYAVGNVFNALQYGGDAHSLIENAIGSWSDDTINGNAITNVLIGGAGNDNMFGNGGDDQLFGWSGDDLLRGGSGDDVGTGNEGNDRLFGEDGRDSLNGGAGNDVVAGWSGDDQLGGGDGDDFLFGEAGDDVLWGEGGADQILGGIGNDILIGGPGSDSFVYALGWGIETVLDFEHGAAARDTVVLLGTGWSSANAVWQHLEYVPASGLTNLWLSATSVIRFFGISPADFQQSDFVLA